MGVSEYRCALITDSCCDLPRATVDRYGIEVLAFPFMLDDVEHLDDLGDSLSHSAFFDGDACAAPFPRRLRCR